MRKLVLLGLLFLLFASPTYAVSITSLSITDVLNNDLSMRETILISIENNTEREFALALPENSYDMTVNGTPINNVTVSDEIACEKCEAVISYSFPNIIINNSGNYTFYRKIEMPINVSSLKYSIIIPENHSLFNISDLQSSILPDSANIITSRLFKWSYENPEFPKEFAVRYRENVVVKRQINYSSIIIIALITFLALSLIAVLMMLIKKRK